MNGRRQSPRVQMGTSSKDGPFCLENTATKGKGSRADVRSAEAFSLLKAQFPEFDKCLIEGMLEDQGGDVEDVQFSLKVGCLQAAKPVLDAVFSEIRVCFS